MVPGYDALAAYASLRAGELPDAVAEATAALGWGIVDRLGVAVWCHAFLARVAVHQGELDVAATELAAADELIDQGRAQLGWDHVGLARAALAERQGDLAAAYASLADVWDLHLALGARSAAQETGPELVRLETLLGSHERTDAVLDVLGSSARRIGDATRLADLDRAAAWHRRDVDRLERAIAHSRRSPRRLVTATALAELATWYRADGRRSAADEAARAARELFVACGAVGDAHLVEPALRGGGAHQADATTGPAALSRREAAVVTLVAEGLANAEIATRLYVSRRTVESHVSSAYRKLGVSNRVELARIGSQLGFATGSDATAATWRSRPA
jgi:ATP/maltotriose-dependent transcriptional regulator MalT